VSSRGGFAGRETRLTGRVRDAHSLTRGEQARARLSRGAPGDLHVVEEGVAQQHQALPELVRVHKHLPPLSLSLSLSLSHTHTHTHTHYLSHAHTRTRTHARKHTHTHTRTHARTRSTKARTDFAHEDPHSVMRVCVGYADSDTDPDTEIDGGRGRGKAEARQRQRQGQMRGQGQRPGHTQGRPTTGVADTDHALGAGEGGRRLKHGYGHAADASTHTRKDPGGGPSPWCP
jgi:hypothetical protein